MSEVASNTTSAESNVPVSSKATNGTYIMPIQSIHDELQEGIYEENNCISGFDRFSQLYLGRDKA